MAKPYQTAVVMGGNLGGMVAARVLSEHFEQVIVLERDIYPEGYAHRKGVPQSRHPHLMLGAGKDALDTLFPGFTERVVENGGRVINPGETIASLEASGWAPQTHSPGQMLYASRLIIDPTVRSFVEAIDNVEIRQGYQVTGLCWNEDNSRVLGAKAKHLETGEEANVLGDLTVDCCGRASRLLRWFADAGLPQVPRMTLDAKCAYSTVWLEAPNGDKPDHIWWEGIAMQPLSGDVPHEHQFLGVILPTENNQWIATMGSWNDYAGMPKDFDSYLEVAKKMRSPYFHKVIADAKPVSDVNMTKTTHNFWNRFDQWSASVGGIVAIGDANQGFNPFYGQGMSCCAKAGLILADHLNSTSIKDNNFHKTFAAKLNNYLEVPWALAGGRDSIMEKAEGSEVLADGWQKRLLQKISIPFFEVILRASRADDVVAVEFDNMINLRIGMNDFMRKPSVLARIGWSEMKYRLGVIDANVTPQDQAPPKVLLQK